MQNPELQIQLVDSLDHVISRVEEILTSSQALNQINIDILKTDLRNLYRVVCEIERKEIQSPAESVQKMKESVSELKKKIISAQQGIASPNLFTQLEEEPVSTVSASLQEEEPEPPLHIVSSIGMGNDNGIGSSSPSSPQTPFFRPVVEQTDTPIIPDEEKLETIGTGTGKTEEPVDATEEPVDVTEEPVDVAEETISNNGIETMAESTTSENFDESISVDTGIETNVNEEATSAGSIDNTMYPEIETEKESIFLSESEILPVTEPDATTEEEIIATEEDEETFPEPVPVMENDNMQETGIQPDLSEFITHEEDITPSYVTQLSAMAQAHVQHSEEDTRKVAVSSTAMPDQSPSKPKSSILDSLKQAAELQNSDPQNSLRSLVDRYKTAKTVNDAHQPSAESIYALIGINEKFQFINELFKGNMREYKEMLANLDICSTKEDVMYIIEPLMKKYQWNPESDAYNTFLEILKRKFNL